MCFKEMIKIYIPINIQKLGLYQVMAFLGLIIFLAFLIGSVYFKYTLKEQEYQLEALGEEIKVETRANAYKLRSLEKKMNHLLENGPTLVDPLELNDELSILSEMSINNQKRLIEKERFEKLLGYQKDINKVISYFKYIGAAAGFLIGAIGFSFWYSRVQLKADRLLK